jgi:hypothetical protein
MKHLLTMLALLLSANLLAQQDDPFTGDVNEGRWGSGYDNPFTEEINEGAIEEQER